MATVLKRKSSWVKPSLTSRPITNELLSKIRFLNQEPGARANVTKDLTESPTVD